MPFITQVHPTSQQSSLRASATLPHRNSLPATNSDDGASNGAHPNVTQQKTLKNQSVASVLMGIQFDREEIVETAPPPATLTLRWADEAACASFAARLAACPEVRRAFITLHGGLGAGKTTFTRHLLRALGVAGAIKSPTYAIMESYDAPGGLAIAHFDFYRFDDPREWEDAGLRDAFAAASLRLAEWPEKAAGVLPAADLALHIAHGEGDDNARSVQITAHSALGGRILGALRDGNHA